MVQTTNRLIHESSPYLLQHAENPVDWYPWGDEAFEKAKKDDKPVFVSIGYSTCHWCHIMEHESFQDPQIASILNSFFVSIKVDREERPDIDSIYMDVAQAMTGSGGWPLSVFMTPDGKPFFCGTYFPPRDAAGRPGFANLLLALHDVWMQRRTEITEVTAQAGQFFGGLPQPPREISLALLHKIFGQLKALFDAEFAGFSKSPKFPQPSLLSFLLVYHHRTRDPAALNMVENTLQAMAAGGICDHLAGGYHRYCVDRQWHIPHFEKMLYDQALMARACLQTFQVTCDTQYADMAREIFRYVLRDLTDPSGGFYSAQDADSEGQEGLFYLWDYQQVLSILGPQDGPLFADCYQVRPEGNFESKNILHRVKNLRQVAQNAGLRMEDLDLVLRKSRQKLLEHRSGRIHPARDEKIITAWNGLMISALAYGSDVLHEPACLEAARHAAHRILRDLLVEGRLRRSFAAGHARQPAFLEDYAFLANGLLDLYQADFDPQWLSAAIVLIDEMLDLFEDKENGGFFFTGSDVEQLIIRRKPQYDAAIPSGNAAAIIALLKAAALSSRSAWLEHARKALQVFASDMEDHGLAAAEMMIAADYWLGPRQEVLIAGPRRDAAVTRFIDLFYNCFLPRAVVMLSSGQPGEDLLQEINPSIRVYQTVNSSPAAYVCENFACKAPCTGVQEFQDILKTL